MTENGVSDSLLMVYTIVRHGDRGPLEFTPNDLNKNYWGNQKGKLTNRGKGEAYELGLWLRKYYGDLLPAEYNTNDVYAYSTDCDRTLMTVQCILAAMYPPSKTSQWHKGINWQPIPVHLTRHKCEEIGEMFNGLSIESFPKGLCTTESLIEKHNDFKQSESLREEWHIHIFGEGKMKLGNVVVSGDNMAIAKKLGLPYEMPPNFDVDALFLSVLDIVSIGSQILPCGVAIGGSILRTVNEYINQRMNEKNSYKMVIYSAHDFSIIALLALLGIQLPHPQYCGSATFELHRLSDGKHYIKFYFRVKYDSDVMDVPIIDGQKYCSLQQFQDIIEEKCQINKFKN